MRKKLAFCFLLLLVALFSTVLAALFLTPAKPELRRGMPRAEVVALLGEPRDSWCSEHTLESQEVFYHEPDGFGNHYAIVVNFDGDHVTMWGIEPIPRTRPLWLNQILKWAGW